MQFSLTTVRDFLYNYDMEMVAFEPNINAFSAHGACFAIKWLYGEFSCSQDAKYDRAIDDAKVAACHFNRIDSLQLLMQLHPTRGSGVERRDSEDLLVTTAGAVGSIEILEWMKKDNPDILLHAEYSPETSGTFFIAKKRFGILINLVRSKNMGVVRWVLEAVHGTVAFNKLLVIGASKLEFEPLHDLMDKYKEDIREMQPSLHFDMLLDAARLGDVVRLNTMFEWDIDGSRPRLFKVTSSTQAGHMLCAAIQSQDPEMVERILFLLYNPKTLKPLFKKGFKRIINEALYTAISILSLEMVELLLNRPDHAERPDPCAKHYKALTMLSRKKARCCELAHTKIAEITKIVLTKALSMQ